MGSKGEVGGAVARGDIANFTAAIHICPAPPPAAFPCCRPPQVLADPQFRAHSSATLLELFNIPLTPGVCVCVWWWWCVCVGGGGGGRSPRCVPDPAARSVLLPYAVQATRI